MTRCYRTSLLLVALLLVFSLSQGFTSTSTSRITSTRTRPTTTTIITNKALVSSSSPAALQLAYASPEESDTPESALKKSLYPKVGDLVRYYDLDGGNQQGQVLVGKISFLIKTSAGWIAELTQLEDVGDGFYAEYSSSKRMRKKTDRNLEYVSPIVASFVRAEQAFKVPLEAGGQIRVRQETYDLEDFEGYSQPINEDVVQADGVLYGELKARLLKNVALTGLVGSLLVNILKGTEDAAIYLVGALASLGYLYFLSVKTDTLGGVDGKLGKNVSNLRFLMPVLVIVGVALYNQSRGELNPLAGSSNLLDTVTTEQFACAVIGFLTYRIPLFLGQLLDALKDDDGGVALPGSAGVAMKLATSANDQVTTTTSVKDLIPVLVVSGPQATGRTELVQRLLEENQDRLVAPSLIDKVQDGVTFERLASRGEILEIQQERFGLTTDSILQAATAGSVSSKEDNEDGSTQKVVVIDANIELAKRLTRNLAGCRLIGVWIGLNSVKEFETRLKADIASGIIQIPPDETEESVLRARIKEIVYEIEFGLGAGIFEFTILNDDPEKSLMELREAASYCFK